MKLLFRAVCCAVIISCLLSLTGFGAACQDIGDNVLRLHILANSDSESDQELKLKVRDGITEYMSESTIAAMVCPSKGNGNAHS